MPFVDITWDPARLTADGLVRLRDNLPSIVARALTSHDPGHLVTGAMVDIRVTTSGLYDRLNRDLYVTVLARTEPERDINKLAIVRQISDAVRSLGAPTGTMVELVLTNRVSVYDYGDG